MNRARAVLDDCERFFRGSYLSYSWLLVLLGLGSANAESSFTQILAALVLGLNYHLFGYIHNDLIDLPHDRTQARRARDPLVEGRVSIPAAWLVAVIQIPISYVLLWLVHASGTTYVALSLGYLTTTLYNVYGKRFMVPMATDAVQGIAWACLALTAAGIAGPATALTWIPAAFGFAFVFLINGVHGSLRDIDNDYPQGMITTAIFLGARPTDNNRIVSTRRLIVFAFGAFALLLLPPPLLIAWEIITPSWPQNLAMGLWGSVNVVSGYLLWRVVRLHEPHRLRFIYLHQLPLLIPPMIIMFPLIAPRLQLTLVVGFFLPFVLFLPNLWSFAEHLARSPTATHTHD